MQIILFYNLLAIVSPNFKCSPYNIMVCIILGYFLFSPRSFVTNVKLLLARQMTQNVTDWLTFGTTQKSKVNIKIVNRNSPRKIYYDINYNTIKCLASILNFFGSMYSVHFWVSNRLLSNNCCLNKKNWKTDIYIM